MSPLVAAVREYAFGVETLALGYKGAEIVHPVDAFATQTESEHLPLTA